MPGPEFFQTGLGHKFYERDVPKIAKALERIADALEQQNRYVPLEQRPEWNAPPSSEAHGALGVIVRDPKIRAWLAEHSPKALEQAERAFEASEP